MILLLWSSLSFAASVEVSPVDDIVSLVASLSPGSEIVFTDGTYTLAEPLSVTAPGTADQPIVLRAKEGATPIIEHSDGWVGLYIYDSAYLTVDGLTFLGADGWEDMGDYGVYVEDSSNVTLSNLEVGQFAYTLIAMGGNNSAMTVSNNHLHDTLSGAGISVGCSDASCWTEGSTFSGNWIHGLQGTSSLAIYLAPGNQGNAVIDNVIHDVNYRGMRVDSTEYGDPNTVEGNVVWNANEVAIDARGASRVRNNVVFNIEGIGIKSADNGRGTLDDVVISFNTVVNTTGYAVSIEDWAGRTGNVLANNAICNPTGYGLYFESSSDTGGVDYGLVSGNAICGLVLAPEDLADGYVPAGGYDDFVDPEGWDFYPTGASHLKDSADPSGETWVPELDFNGAPRQGNAPDVGAYEYVGEGNPGWQIREAFKETGYTAGAGEEVGGGCCGDKGESKAGLLLAPMLALGALRRRRG